MIAVDKEPTPLGYFVDAYRKYATFSGRARRKEYWYFFLFQGLIIWGIYIIHWIFAFNGLAQAYGPNQDFQGANNAIGVSNALAAANWICFLVGLLPTISVTVRRLHDTGRSGWYMLLFFIPVVGLILWLVMLTQESQHGPNQYGTNPKEIAPSQI